MERFKSSLSLVGEGISNLDFGKFKTGIKGATTAFGGLKTALASLGIGLIIQAKENFFEYLKINDTQDLFLDNTEVYVRFSPTYNESVFLLMMNPNYFYVLRLINDEDDKEPINLGAKDSLEVVNDYAEKSDDNIYDGIKLKLGKTTLNEITAKDKFITIIDEKWAIFDRNDNYFLVVNLKLDVYSICCRYIKGENANLKNPVFFYIDKHTEKTPYLTNEKLSNDIRNKIEIFLKESIKKTSEIKKDNEDDFKFFRRIKKFFDK